MLKNSFTLFETILSLSLIAILVAGFIQSSHFDSSNAHKFTILNQVENLFDTNDLNSFDKSSKNVKLTIDGKTRYINLTAYIYNKDGLKLVKYEK